jgi:hypothetical protein
MPDVFGPPPIASTLRDAAAPDRSPPEENGERLVTIQRGEDDEVRLSWARYSGRPFLNVRVGKTDDAGTWWPEKSKGLSVRVKELPAFAEGLAQSIDRALKEPGE